METPGDEVWGRTKVTASVSVFCWLQRHLIQRQNNWVKGAETNLSVTLSSGGCATGLGLLLKKKLTFKKPRDSVSPSQGGLETVLFIKCFEILSENRTKEEMASSKETETSYRGFTDLRQQRPCCNGPRPAAGPLLGGPGGQGRVWP